MHVPSRILECLRCPVCGRGVVPGDGDVRCPAGHSMPTTDGYVDASSPPSDPDVARTLASFGYEWTTFDAVQPEDEQFWEVYFRHVPLDRLRGRVALDAGCGKGRFTYFTARHVTGIVALDGSAAVEAAARNLAAHDNVVVVKSDVRSMPFADRSFGFVSCLGVLHHLPDPEAGFAELVRLLSPDGYLLVYVYSRPASPGLRAAGLRAARIMRRVTVRTPHWALRSASAVVAGLLWAVLVLPGRVRRSRGRTPSLPLAAYRSKPFRSLWLDTFDRLSAPLEARYLWEEIAGWFSAAGLEVLHARDEAGWFVVAHRPEEAPPGGRPGG